MSSILYRIPYYQEAWNAVNERTTDIHDELFPLNEVVFQKS